MEALGGGNRLEIIYNWLFSLKMSGREVIQLLMQQLFIFHKESGTVSVYSDFWLGLVGCTKASIFSLLIVIFPHNVPACQYIFLTAISKSSNLPVQCEEVNLRIQNGAASGD